MNVPEGYVALDFVGFTDRGDYSPNENYVENDLVHKDNSIWKCLIDDVSGIEPGTDETKWSIYIRSTSNASGILAVDTENIVGGGNVSLQSLVDAIADRVINKLVTIRTVSYRCFSR